MIKLFGRLPKYIILAAILTGLGIFAEPLSAQTSPAPAEGPLTQADIDAYIFLLPKMAQAQGGTPEEMGLVLRESGLTRRRAVYVVTKVALAQSLAQGLMSPGQLVEEEVPANLHPTTEEIRLITNNLTSLVQAQAAARRAAGELSD